MEKDINYEFTFVIFMSMKAKYYSLCLVALCGCIESLCQTRYTEKATSEEGYNH